ncbi:MAG: four helix bundle protein [Bacteroidota bacterium]|nr:four helix bundle protein [Bacteroidota bacterium]
MQKDKIYDLLERTERFSLRVRDFCLKVKKDIINREYIVQLIRAAGSAAGNYIEANENLGDRDLKFRIKICRKESKESKLWLKHVLTYGDNDLEKERLELIQEAFELEQIFGAILKKLIQKDQSKVITKQ